jgi:hypothetical protein
MENAVGGVGAGGIPTYNLGDPQYLLQGGIDAYAARLEMEVIIT